MADWATPTLATIYSTFLTNLSDRLVDSGTMFSSAPTNAPDKIKRWNASTNIFEIYSSGTTLWTAMVLGVAGGGTGGITASAARTNLGLGTLAVQDASTVAITGGTITGITSFSITGAITAGGKITTTSAATDSIKTAGGITAGGTVPIINVNGKIPAISSTYFADLSGANLTGLGSTAWSGLTGTPPAVSIFSNDVPYLTTASVASAMVTYLGAFTADIIPSTDASRAIGTAAKSVNTFYVYDIYPKLPYTTVDFCDPVVQDNTTDRRLYAKTDGATVNLGAAVTGLTVEKGIVTAASATSGLTDVQDVAGGINRIQISMTNGLITALTIT